MKLYFGNTTTTITTIMILALLGFVSYSFANRANIRYWVREIRFFLMSGGAVLKIVTMEIARIIL